jgi:hypothetical protein
VYSHTFVSEPLSVSLMALSSTAVTETEVSFARESVDEEYGIVIGYTGNLPL